LEQVRQCELTGEEEEPAPVRAVLACLFCRLERTRLLTMLREGPWGCNEINRYLAQRVGQRLGSAGRDLFPGAPVLVTRNDSLRGLFNGDVGLALADRSGGVRVAFVRQDRFVSFAADALPPHELGFALTVHKSQGSEYEHVLLLLPPQGGRRLLTKELVYTGVTRARKLAIVCATPEALRSAVSRRVERDMGLLGTLQE
jgi:exodeoxyribonuclease V alpha subunit